MQSAGGEKQDAGTDLDDEVTDEKEKEEPKRRGGWKLSRETRIKQGLAKLGMPMSEEAKKNMSAAQKARRKQEKEEKA